MLSFDDHPVANRQPRGGLACSPAYILTAVTLELALHIPAPPLIPIRGGLSLVPLHTLATALSTQCKGCRTLSRNAQAHYDAGLIAVSLPHAGEGREAR
jgi:hypothetical protein